MEGVGGGSAGASAYDISNKDKNNKEDKKKDDNTAINDWNNVDAPAQ